MKSTDRSASHEAQRAGAREEQCMTELGVVRRKVARAERAAVEALGRTGVATVHEAMGRVGLMSSV